MQSVLHCSKHHYLLLTCSRHQSCRKTISWLGSSVPSRNIRFSINSSEFDHSQYLAPDSSVPDPYDGARSKGEAWEPFLKPLPVGNVLASARGKEAVVTAGPLAIVFRLGPEATGFLVPRKHCPSAVAQTVGREIRPVLDQADGRCACGVGEMEIGHSEQGATGQDAVSGRETLSKSSRVQWLWQASRGSASEMAERTRADERGEGVTW
ncbi:hypothetical protein LXA43DRAFT_1021805 [Ganoderma leucocontextum]|nr:hypothetical protein LXA43DRAFT_1021805 [Ganoderma leucocontextum]